VAARSRSSPSGRGCRKIWRRRCQDHPGRVQKVQPQIQGDAIRVQAKAKDDLQGGVIPVLPPAMRTTIPSPSNSSTIVGRFEPRRHEGHEGECEKGRKDILFLFPFFVSFVSSWFNVINIGRLECKSSARIIS